MARQRIPSDFDGVIDEAKIFKKIPTDDKDIPIDRNLPGKIYDIVKEYGQEHPTGKSELFRKQAFIEVMERLEEENYGLVEFNLLEVELEKTGTFQPSKITPYIKRMYIESVIYQPKGGFFKLV